jgi:hypothetical protein
LKKIFRSPVHIRKLEGQARTIHVTVDNTPDFVHLVRYENESFHLNR